MAALLPYAPGTVESLAALGTHQNIRRGAGLLRDYGPGAVRAARKIGAAVRRRQRMKRARQVHNRRRVGESIGTGNAKRHQVIDSGPTSQTTRNLYVTDVTAIPKTTSNEIDSRQRDMIQYKGFRYCEEWHNTSDKPLLCNIAVVAGKGETDYTRLTDNFFRGTGTTRALSFTTTLGSLDFHCRPINTDKYIVLSHERFVLGTRVTDKFFEDTKNYAMKTKWVKVGRQIRYEDASGVTGSAKTPIYLVHWCDQMTTPAGTTELLDAMMHSQQITAYFAEPKN